MTDIKLIQGRDQKDFTSKIYLKGGKNYHFLQKSNAAGILNKFSNMFSFAGARIRK